MRFKIETKSLRGLLINISLAGGLLTILSFTFFYEVLPRVTNKGKVVTVPDLSGMSFEEARKFLETRELSYEVTDSAYNSESAPLTVLEQFPRPLSRVKIERKINLKLNARTAPLVYIPDLTGSTFDFAQKQLRTLDIKIGSIKYRPDIAVNSIIEVSFKGNKIQAGQRIPKGSKLDMIVGTFADGDGTTSLPDFTGLSYDEVEFYLIAFKLKIGEVHNVPDDNVGLNIIQKQRPLPGDSVKRSDTVDLWVFNLQGVE